MFNETPTTFTATVRVHSTAETKTHRISLVCHIIKLCNSNLARKEDKVRRKETVTEEDRQKQTETQRQIIEIIKLLHSQGMSEYELLAIFVALIISRTLYALPAWHGFLNSQQINMINAFFWKAQ